MSRNNGGKGSRIGIKTKLTKTPSLVSLQRKIAQDYQAGFLKNERKAKKMFTVL